MVFEVKHCKLCDALKAAIKAVTKEDHNYLICQHSLQDPKFSTDKLKKDLSGIEWLSNETKSERVIEREDYSRFIKRVK